MRIRDVKYIGSFGYPGKLPREARPEVVFLGRSNVGKSSLINTLLQRHGVARISKTPGKTRMANFFRINNRFHFVDMPGYGYAKVPKAEIERFRKLFKQYLADDSRKNAYIQLLDMRHPPTNDDVANVAAITATGRPMCLVFNKSDKVKQSAKNRSISEALSVFDVAETTAVIPFSSVTGEGKGPLWLWIIEVLSL